MIKGTARLFLALVEETGLKSGGIPCSLLRPYGTEERVGRIRLVQDEIVKKKAAVNIS